MKISFSIFLSGLLLAAASTAHAATVYTPSVYISANGGAAWVVSAGSPAQALFSSLASSADGSKLAGVSGLIYTSTDSGLTWNKGVSVSTPTYTNRCVSAASSTDGMKLAAVGSGVFVSTNAGVTWTQQFGAWNRIDSPTNGWTSVASSVDGMKLVVVGPAVLTSTNGGATWSQQPGAPSGNWKSIACSSDGAKIVGGHVAGLFVSNDAGATWRKTVGPSVSRQVVSSADGMKLAAVGANLKGEWRIYTSADEGTNWTEITAPVQNWITIASSADGTRLVAASTDGFIYTTTNSGATWTQNVPKGTWSAVSCSSDGTKLVASGTIATFVPDPPQPASVRVSLWNGGEEGGAAVLRVFRNGNPNVAFTLDYSTITNGTALPGVNFVPQTGRLTFTLGELYKDIQVPILNDGRLNFGLSFGIQFSNATAGVVIEQASALVQIADRQYPAAFDLRFIPNFKCPTRVAVAAARTDDQLLVADGAVTGQKSVVKLVMLSADGSRLAEWPAVFEGGSIYSLAFFLDGKVLVSGSFTNVNGLPRKGIVRLHADGSVDQALAVDSPGFSLLDLGFWPHSPATIPLPDGGLVAVMTKDPLDSSLPWWLVRLKPDERIDQAFRPVKIEQGQFPKIVPDNNGRILVSGTFLNKEENATQRLVRLNSEGSVETGFAPVLSGDEYSGGLADFALQPDGKILVAGDFSTVNGLTRRRLARLNEDGTTDETFTYQPDLPQVYLVAVDTDGTVLAAGWEGLQRLTASGGRMKAVPLKGLIQNILSSKNGTVLASIWMGDVGTVLTRVLLDEPPRTAIVLSSQDYFVPFRPFETHLEITEAPDGGNLEITVRRLGDVLAPATVTITTRDGTAKAGEDYVPVKQTVSFTPFEQEKTIVIEALADSVFDPDNTFDLILTNVSGVEAVSPPVKVTINDGRARVDTVRQLADEGVEVTFYWPPVRNYVLEGSSDLKTWAPVASEVSAEAGLGPHRFRAVDQQVRPSPARFYRLTSR